MPVDYSVYLVTDSTPAILGDRDLLWVVEESLKGGVTLVQYRDKHLARDEFVATARKLHELTKRYGVPLLINDRVDVAVEIGCEGVHVGQEDLQLAEVRKAVGPDAIVGVTASSADEALAAAEGGATYLGIGTVYATQTKKDTKSVIGPTGVASILAALARSSSSQTSGIPTVCIGGVGAADSGRIMQQCETPAKGLDGVAVVSAVMAAPDPAEAAGVIAGQVLAARLPRVVRAVAELTPLSHNMTNLVVQNFAANVALAVGASPIMSNNPEEAADLAKLGGALVVNMGTVTPEGLRSYMTAIQAYNAAGRPVVYDPVGAGATSVRRQAVKTLLASGQLTVIKGNEGEIQTLHGATVEQKGVDSSSTLDVTQRAALVRSLAIAREGHSVVVMTGVTDVVSDGRRTVRIDNGHAYLGMVTGTGCTLGTTISAMVAAYPQDALIATAAGVAVFGVAAEMAAGRAEVRGPGTFVPAFLDELYAIRKATAEGDMRWLTMVKIQGVRNDDSSL